MNDLREMDVADLLELFAAIRYDGTPYWANAPLEERDSTVSSILVELERRCAVPEEATYKEAPLSDMRGSVAWANGWNACLAKIKEMRDG